MMKTTKTNELFCPYFVEGVYEGNLDTHTHARTRAHTHEGVSKSFRTGRQERELQMVQLSAIRCNCIAIL